MRNASLCEQQPRDRATNVAIKSPQNRASRRQARIPSPALCHTDSAAALHRNRGRRLSSVAHRSQSQAAASAGSEPSLPRRSLERAWMPCRRVSLLVVRVNKNPPTRRDSSRFFYHLQIHVCNRCVGARGGLPDPKLHGRRKGKRRTNERRRRTDGPRCTGGGRGRRPSAAG